MELRHIFLHFKVVTCRSIVTTLYFKGNVVYIKCYPLSAKVDTNFADKRRSLGRYSALADTGIRVSFILTVNLLSKILILTL
jgi:hypothetical protein